MAIYVTADIHGCYDEYMALLDKAGVELEKDKLIIAGDIVDRGSGSLEMLRYLKSEPENVTFLKGNHDEDFQFYCSELKSLYEKEGRGLTLREYVDKYPEIFYWNFSDRYGTVYELTHKPDVKIEDFAGWYESFSKMEYFKKLEIDGRKYIIVHAGYISDEEYAGFCNKGGIEDYLKNNIEAFYVWARKEGYDYSGEDDATVVFGHTPKVIESSVFYNKGKAKVMKKGKRRFINIDCGGVFRKHDENCNFCLLRLDDEKFFYLYD